MRPACLTSCLDAQPPPHPSVHAARGISLRVMVTAALMGAVLAVLSPGAVPALGATGGPPAGSSPPGPPFRPGVVLVGFRRGTSPPVQRAVAASARGSLARTTAPRIRVVRVGPGRVSAAIRSLRRRHDVLFAEPDYLLREAATPNDPSFPLQWGFQNTGQLVNGTSGTAGADEHVTRAWDLTTGTSSVVVAEADSGVDYTHPDLAANIWSNPGGVGNCPAGTHGYNVLTGSCDPMDDETYFGGHGTHVAGIIGAVGNNGIGVTGVNWHTTILPVKWLRSGGYGYTSELISALQWILQAKQAGVNVRVINDSATFSGTAYSQALSDEIDALGQNDILFVTAAGGCGDPNQCSTTGANNDNTSVRRYPCGYDRPNELCVTASDQNDQLPAWAYWGPNTVDLAAPGANIYSTLRSGACSNPPCYGYISGTSMASPQVAGAAALILSRGYQSATALKADILNNVDPLPSLSGLIRSGGRLDVCRALPGCGAGYAATVLATPGLVGYWRLGEASGSTAFDSKGSSNGSYVGGVTLGQPGALVGDPNTAAAFDGTGYVSLPNLGSSSSFTVEGWTKLNSAAVNSPNGNNTLYGHSWDVRLIPRPSGIYADTGVGSAVFSVQASTPNNLGSWVYWALVRNGSTLAIYRNGSAVGSTSNLPSGPSILGGTVAANSGSQLFLHGTADEVAVYDTALTPSTIQQHYQLAR